MEVRQLGNILPTISRDNPNQGRVYDADGLCPALTNMQGGGRQPMITESKVIGGFGEKKSNGGTQWYQQDRVYSMGDVAMCHPANIPQGSYKYMDNQYRIRKLTPLECWRLMDFSDEDFHKSEMVNSNTQLYKQAGNSIVRNVLVAIFGQMIEGKENAYKRINDRK